MAVAAASSASSPCSSSPSPAPTLTAAASPTRGAAAAAASLPLAAPPGGDAGGGRGLGSPGPLLLGPRRLRLGRGRPPAAAAAPLPGPQPPDGARGGGRSRGARLSAGRRRLLLLLLGRPASPAPHLWALAEKGGGGKGKGEGSEAREGAPSPDGLLRGSSPPCEGLRAGEGGPPSWEGRGLNPNCRRPAPDRRRPPSCFFVSASARSALTGGSGGGSRPRAPHVTGAARRPPPGGAAAAARHSHVGAGAVGRLRAPRSPPACSKAPSAPCPPPSPHAGTERSASPAATRRHLARAALSPAVRRPPPPFSPIPLSPVPLSSAARLKPPRSPLSLLIRPSVLSTPSPPHLHHAARQRSSLPEVDPSPQQRRPLGSTSPPPASAAGTSLRGRLPAQVGGQRGSLPAAPARAGALPLPRIARRKRSHGEPLRTGSPRLHRPEGAAKLFPPPALTPATFRACALKLQLLGRNWRAW